MPIFESGDLTNKSDNLNRVSEVLRREGFDLTASEVGEFLLLAQEKTTLGRLSTAMVHMPSRVQPALARAAQATENVYKSIEDEFGLLISSEVAEFLGSKSKSSSARSLANDMRGRGELLAFRRLNKFVYPGFQFDAERGQVRPLVKKATSGG